MITDNGRAPSGQALAVPVEPVSRLDPSGFDPSRSVFSRWRLYADRLYRNAESRRAFEREYTDWYSAKFGIVPEMTDALRMQFLPIWAAYRMGREEAHNAD